MFDDKVVSCFLDNQLQLFPEEVASTMAVVNERFSDYLEEVIGSI